MEEDTESKFNAFIVLAISALYIYSALIGW